MRAARWQYSKDLQLQIRMLVVCFLMAFLDLAFLLILSVIGIIFWYAVAITALTLGLQYYFCDKLLLWEMKAKELPKQNNSKLHHMVERLASEAGLPKPKIALVDWTMPNAFAIGRNPAHSVIVVTIGLLKTINSPELEAVLAHEVSHIKNGDTTIMTMAAFFSAIIYLIVSYLYSVAYSRNGFVIRPIYWLAYLLARVVWLISLLLVRALSRYRELSADRGAAILTGSSSHLASALIKIGTAKWSVTGNTKNAARTVNALFFTPARISDLFSTHPPLEKRLRQLMQLHKGVVV